MPFAVVAGRPLSLALRHDCGRPILLLLQFSSVSLGGSFSAREGIDAPHECVDAPFHVPPPELPASGGWAFHLGIKRSYHLESDTRGLRSTAPPDSPLLRLFGPVGAADGDSNEDSAAADLDRAGVAVVRRRGGKPRFRVLRFGRSERGCFPCEDALEASRDFGNEASSPFPFDQDISETHTRAHRGGTPAFFCLAMIDLKQCFYVRSDERRIDRLLFRALEARPEPGSTRGASAKTRFGSAPLASF